MATLVKTTLDGRKVEVIGLAICLDGRLEAVELTDVNEHPMRRAIRATAPEATHMAGRLALTKDEVQIVRSALNDAETRMLADPVAINERFRLAAMRKAREEGIE
ncbi:hypothetical protein GCM10007301_09370 [Azorhizobium oxalatiphilum]|uniref:Uncharacterized protein n=1 Tax=Azorhizobium oxalatiphilum TaxID=980631 RepID=A0A917BPN7_9HYPH|nr:hypothetical protein [Azorhizobium oxalatiphilum]GGF52039.1 hypothetical protein GCM10007301_09370 [Azorhizobium oxalatiphilum]